MDVSEDSKSRKEKRKEMKKLKRKQLRKEIALKEREDEEVRLNDPEEQRRVQLMEQEEAERVEREGKLFEERERALIEEFQRKKAQEEEEERRKVLEESRRQQVDLESDCNEDDNWEYVEEGPPEIIWQANEIILRKKKVRVPKKDPNKPSAKEDADRPTSNPLPPQSAAFANFQNASLVSAQQALESVAEQVPNFGTEQDKAHCPFHLKTGACRFGQRCSRVHFYPDKSCTLLLKNMYNGPGLAWEQDEGLEYTDEEIERCYEEFYEDVHTEFLKFGEIVNFKVCKNGSFHLRGNVYVHYKSLESAVLAYHSIIGRYFAGKQVKCEFVNVTRWKVAICGEYMKLRLKTCTHGTACNFIHCFRNPGGDYEWADWDKPPPKYWSKKMAALFGYSDELGYEKQTEKEYSGKLRKSSSILSIDAERHWSRRSRSREVNQLKSYSARSHNGEDDVHASTHQQRRRTDRKQNKALEERTNYRNCHLGQRRSKETSCDGDWSDRDRDVDTRHSLTRKGSKHHTKMSEYLDTNKSSYDIDSDGDSSDGDRDKRKHSSHAKKSSRVDVTEDSKDKIQEADGDRLNGNKGRERKHSPTRKRSRHRSKHYPDDFWDIKNENGVSGGELSDRERDRKKRHSHRRKKLGYENKATELADAHKDSKYETPEVNGVDDWSAGNKEGQYSCRRKSSRLDSEVPESSDDKDEPEKLESNFQRETSDGDTTPRQSIRRSRLNGDHEGRNPDRFEGRYGLHDVDHTYVDTRDRWDPQSADDD